MRCNVRCGVAVAARAVVTVATLTITGAMVGCGSKTEPLVLDVDDGATPTDSSVSDSSIEASPDTGTVDSMFLDVPTDTAFDSGRVDTAIDAAIDTLVFDTRPDFGPDAPTLAFLSIEPLGPTVFIDSAPTPHVAGTQAFIIKEHYSDGTVIDITPFAKCTLADPSIGSLSTGNVFTSVTDLPGGAYGGWSTLGCYADGLDATTTVSVVELRKTGDHKDFYFLEPYGGTPTPARDVLKFGTNIKAVDVALSVDTTGSMGTSITALKDSLSSTIIPGLKTKIPDVAVAVAYHDDYPYGGHGTPGCLGGTGALPGDVPSGLVTPLTTDVPTAQAAVNKLETHCGGDEPEAQVPSMLQIVTGAGLTWPGGSVAAHTPAPGTTGGVDFRPGALAVVIEITDAHWHDTTFDPYLDFSGAPTLATDLEPAMKAAGAKFVGVFDVHYITFEDQENALSDATDSNVASTAFSGSCGAGQCCTLAGGGGRPPSGPAGSCRLNFQILNGVGLGDSIVTAISAIAVGTIFDVTAVASNDTTNPGGVDATKFIKALRAMDEGSPADGCLPRSATDTDGDGIKDTFPSTVVGTPVCFEVLPTTNTTVPATSAPQFFDAFIDVIGMPGAVKLDRRTVIFEVPPA